MLLILLLTILSTLYDVYSHKWTSKPNKDYMIFSLRANFNQLFAINRSANVINCLDGMKALSGLKKKFRSFNLLTEQLSAIFIVLGHRKEQSMIKFDTWSKFGKMVMNMVGAGRFCVVTFFAASGVVVCQSILRAYDRCEFIS